MAHLDLYHLQDKIILVSPVWLRKCSFSLFLTVLHRDQIHSGVLSLFLKGYTGLAEAIENWDFSKLEKLELHRQLLKRIEATMLEVDPVVIMPYINTCLIERDCDEILQVW